MIKRRKKLFHLDNILLFLYAFCVVFSMTPTINSISLYVIVPIMGFTLFIKRHKIYYKNKYLYWYLLLILWMALSTITAENSDVALRQMVRLLAAYIFSVISFYLANRNSFIIWLYFIIIFKYIVIMFRVSSGDGLVIAENVSDRDQFNGINANMIAYFLFYATFAVFMLTRLYKKTNLRMLLCISILLLVLSFYISLITASRQVLIIQVPLIISVFFVMCYNFSFKDIAVLICFAILLLVIGWPIAEKFFSNSLLAERSMESITNDSRFYLINKAIEEGCNNPVLGMGPNNFSLKYGMFTHNTYLELWVSSGLLALIIYIYIVSRFIIVQLKRFRQSKDRTFLMFFIYACTFFVDNIFYVFTGNMWLMGLFFIIVGHSEQYYKSYIYETQRYRFPN